MVKSHLRPLAWNDLPAMDLWNYDSPWRSRLAVACAQIMLSRTGAMIGYRQTGNQPKLAPI